MSAAFDSSTAPTLATNFSVSSAAAGAGTGAATAAARTLDTRTDSARAAPLLEPATRGVFRTGRARRPVAPRVPARRDRRFRAGAGFRATRFRFALRAHVFFARSPAAARFDGDVLRAARFRAR